MTTGGRSSGALTGKVTCTGLKKDLCILGEEGSDPVRSGLKELANSERLASLSRLVLITSIVSNGSCSLKSRPSLKSSSPDSLEVDSSL